MKCKEMVTELMVCMEFQRDWKIKKNKFLKTDEIFQTAKVKPILFTELNSHILMSSISFPKHSVMWRYKLRA